MSDPIRKPRKLRFKVTRALLVSGSLVSTLACGEPTSINPGPVEAPPPEERVNVPAMHETPPIEADEATDLEEKAEQLDLDMDSDMDSDTDDDAADRRVRMAPRTNVRPQSMANTFPRPSNTDHEDNPYSH